MAVGTGYGFDLEALNSAINDAEKKFKKLTTTGVNTARAIDEAFKIAANGGLKQFRDGIAGLDAALKGKGADKAIKDIGTSAVDSANKITQLVESIRGGGERFTDLMARINDRGAYNPKNGALESVNTQLDEQRAKLKELKDLLNFYAKGEGLKAVDTAVHPKEYIDAKEREAVATMRLIEKLEQEKKERESLARLQRELAKRQGGIDANYEPRLLEYTQGYKHRMQMESTYAKYSSKLYEDTYNEQIRSYEQLWDKVEKGEKNRDERIAKQKIAEYKATMSEMMALDKAMYSSQKEGKANTAEYDAIEARYKKLVDRKLALEAELDKRIADLKEKADVRNKTEEQKRAIQSGKEQQRIADKASKEAIAKARQTEKEKLALYKATLTEMKSLDKNIYRVDTKGTDAEKNAIAETRNRYKELEAQKTALEAELGRKTTDIRKKFEAEVESETAKRLIRERELREAENKRALQEAKANAKQQAAENKRAENEKIATYRATLAELKSLDKDKYAIESKGKQVQEADKYQKILDRERDLNAKKLDLENQLGSKVNEIRRRFDTERLGEIAKRHIREIELEEKAADKAAKVSSEARRKRYQEYITSYEGAMRTSQRASTKGTFADEEQAIKNLEAARDRLKKSDADYATKLNALNEAIKRHEKSLKDATKTDKDRADEAAKNAKKQLEEERRLYEERARLRREENKKKNQTYEGAMAFSASAKTLNREIQAVKNLEAARAKLTRTDQDYYQKLNAINQRIAEHNRNIERATASTNEHNKALAAIGRGIASAFSVQAIRGYVNKMIQVRGEMELQQRSLQAILQNKDDANEIWQKTIDLAVRSPFRIKDLVTYTKQLAAYRVENDKIFDTTKMLADVSAGLGVDMNRLILAFGQVKAANFLRGTELRQFTEAGIPMLDELAKHFNEMNNTALTSADVFDMISKRMVLFEDVEAVFERMTQAGGTFYRMQEIQSETLRGQISNLKDSLDIMFNEIGKANDGTLKVSVKAVKLLVDNYEKIIPILKSSVVLFAIYKTNALWAARSITTMKGAWDAFAVSWGNFSKTLTLNPWMLWLSAIVAVGAEIYKVWKQFDAVDKQYNDMLNQQSEITSKFFKAKDINEQKKALKELIDLANKEYEFGIEVDIKSVPDDEVKKYMNDLRQRMIEANAFGATFQKELITANLKTKWNDLTWWQSLSSGGIFEQGLNKDIDQMGDSYDNLNRLMINKLAPTIDKLSSEWSILNESQKSALASLKAGIGEWAEAPDEDMVEYFDRIRGNFELLIESDAIADKKLGRQLRKYQRRMEEAEEEFKTFIAGIDETVMGANEEDRTIFLNAAIDDAKAEKNWTEFEETQIRKWLEKKYEIELTPKIAESDTDLKAWQDSYNSIFQGKTGYREIRSKGTTQKQVIEQLNAQYGSTAELLERIQKAGEDSVLEGGAYEGEDLAKLKQDLVEIRMQLDWFGAEAKKDTREEASVKILQRRINLLKEVNKKYLELEKTFGSIEAKEKVMEAYSDTFREAFEGTGVELDMYKIMTQVITDSKTVGEEMGSSLSEGVVAKLKELEESGTYIRTANSAAEEFTKGWEQAILKAKDVEGLGIGYTIGYGEYGTYKDTKKKIGKDDVMTQSEAAERFSRVIYPKYVEGLNKILDKHKELILTQEQYNALLDLTYQGGYGGWSKKLKAWVKGPAELLIDYAKNEEQALAHIQKIRESFAKAYGEAEAERRFGDAFVEKLKQAETIYEKMALLLGTMNLTINGEVKKGYTGMVRRTDARVELFSGGLDIAKQLETVLVKIAGMDFTTTEGMVEALGRLKDIAEKEGEEAQKILSQVISGFEAEIGIRLKKEDAEKIRNEVQEIFDTYNLSLDIKKLHIPPKVAKTFFDVDMLSFDEMRDKVISTFAGTSDKVKEELNKGLLGANWNIVGEVIGKDQVEAVKQALEKIDDLEDKQQKERFKKYLEYAKSTVGERAKIKLEELQKLKEIEETFAIKEGDSDETKAYKWDMMKRARDKAKQESKDAMSSLEWDEFQKTDTFTGMFEDIDFASDALLTHMIAKLKEFKNEWTDMPLEDVKTIVDKLNELEAALAERSPWKSYRSAKEAIKKAREDAMYSFESEDAHKVYGKGKSDKDYVEALQIENEYQEQKALNAEREIAAIEEVLALKTKEQEGNVGNLNLTEEQLAYIGMQEEELRKILGEKKSEVKFSRQIITDNSKTLSQYKNQAKSLLQQSEYLGKVQQMANDLYEAFSELAEALGADSDSPAAIFADMGMNMLNTVLSTIQLHLQLEAAKVSAIGLGAAMNAAMGVVGWIVMAVQLLAQVITAIVQANDKKIDAQVERLRAQVEELEKKYDKLSETIDEVYSTAELEEVSRKLDEIYYKEKRALEQAIAVRKADKNISDDEMDEIADMEEQLIELEEKHAETMKEIVSNATDGIFDSVKDAARDFTDAWYDAFVETGKGINGLEENFNEMFMNLAKQQASMQITQAFVERWKKDLSKYVDEKDTKLTPEEAAAWANEVKATFPELSAALEAFLGTIHESVGGLQSGELSSLQKGIQGITEETAQIIEAYLNSIRGYVSEQVTHTRNIYNILKQATTSDAAAIRVRMVE